MDHAPVNIEEQLPRLMQLTQKDSAEIRELINELAHQDIFVISDGRVVKVIRGKVWTLLESGALSKCFIEDADKI
jgi:hypothetical protein